MKTLVVEDELISRELLKEVVSGFGVAHEAANGNEALEKFIEALHNQEPYDLICMDIMMPGLSGQDTLKKIREIEESNGIAESKRVKVVMVTALSDGQNISDAYGDGACHGYVTKPVTASKFKDQCHTLSLLERDN